jgi:hypothetical protein
MSLVGTSELHIHFQGFQTLSGTMNVPGTRYAFPFAQTRVLLLECCHLFSELYDDWGVRFSKRFWQRTFRRNVLPPSPALKSKRSKRAAEAGDKLSLWPRRFTLHSHKYDSRKWSRWPSWPNKIKTFTSRTAHKVNCILFAETEWQHQGSAHELGTNPSALLSWSLTTWWYQHHSCVHVREDPWRFPEHSEQCSGTYIAMKRMIPIACLISDLCVGNNVFHEHSNHS